MTYTCVPLKDLSAEERQEMIERSERRRKEDSAGRVKSMNPDRDFSWENTNFEGHSDD